MFRQMVTRMGLPAIAGLGLLVGTPAKADTQGWPLQGSNWDTSRASSRSYQGSDAPYYYTYQSPPQQQGGYYGSTETEAYYGPSTTESPMSRPVRVNLRVPSDAKIWFDGTQTKQTGTTRSFESPPLDVGPEYAYQIRVQWLQDSKEVTQTRQINVHAGDVIHLTLR
jgi:uncharacterized protein (TIGR03000 family)